MIECGSLEYAHARIWARLGARADETLWRRIEVARELGAVLEIAQASALSVWLDGVGAASELHAMELALRRHWRERVSELAGWMPPAWREAIGWCGVLVDLPALQHLARGAPAPAWMELDPQLHGLIDTDGAPKSALRALLDAARPEPQRLLALWQAQWQRHAPDPAALQQLMPLLTRHLSAFGATVSGEGWVLRRELRSRLTLLLRRTLIEPVMAFIYLALSALEFERLRGELLRRAAFPHRLITT